MPYVLALVIGLGAGFYAGKVVYETPVTAGTCVDSATKSIGEKFDEIMGIIKE